MSGKKKYDYRTHTTLRLDPELLAELKVRCFRDRVAYNTVINNLIRVYMNRDWKYGICGVHGRQAVDGVYPCC